MNYIGVKLGSMPTGLFSTVFPLFVPFYCSVPRVALMRGMGIPATGKTLNYILGLQMASGQVENMLVMSCAVVAGLLWRGNFLKVQTFLYVPLSIARLFDYCLGRFLESPDLPKISLPMGATLELQRKERLDRIEQQMMAAAMQASNRHLEIGRPQPMNLAQGPGIFGNVRRRSPTQTDQETEGEGSFDGNSESTISEDQVQRFVEMGFNDAQVRQALTSANNNPRLATSLLLQDTM